MPYISTVTSVKISEDKKRTLTKELGEAISLIDGKSERWLMLEIKDSCRMYFHGSDAPCAMVQVQVFGKIDAQKCEELTAEVCRIMQDVLDIPVDSTYVKYEEVSLWGWSSQNF